MQKNKIITFLFILISLLSFTRCKEKNEPIEPVEIEPENSISISLNGNTLSELSYDCEESYFGIKEISAGSYDPNPRIVLKEGFEYRWNDTLSLTLTTYFFDSTTFITYFTKEVLLDFLNNRIGDYLIEIDLKMGDEHFRNFWIEGDWSKIPNLRDRQVMDANADLQFSFDEPIRPLCTGYWEFIPLDISYKGLLKTKEGAQSVTIDDAVIKFFLAEF